MYQRRNDEKYSFICRDQLIGEDTRDLIPSNHRQLVRLKMNENRFLSSSQMMMIQQTRERK